MTPFHLYNNSHKCQPNNRTLLTSNCIIFALLGTSAQEEFWQIVNVIRYNMVPTFAELCNSHIDLSKHCDCVTKFRNFWLSVGSPISPRVRPWWWWCWGSALRSHFWAYLWKQNLFRMSTGCQKDRNTGRQTYRQTDRQTERQIEDRKTFQLSYRNKTCSECQQDVKQKDRRPDWQTECL